MNSDHFATSALNWPELESPETDSILERLLCERSLYEFVQAAWHVVEPDIPFVPSWHLEAICKHLEAVTSGDIVDLLINIPPGCCKSLITCVFWPAWVWISNPAKRFLFASYGQELATRDSMRCRQVLTSVWYRNHWTDRFRLIGDQNEKTKFQNDKSGWRLATSVGGRGTGEHPDFIVVDDPHNVKQADSQTKRQAAIDWWQGTVATRGRSRNVRRVIIMQRLDEEDLSAHVLKSGTFEHICLPMEFEPGRMKQTKIGFDDPRINPGELLWPGLFSPAMVAAIKADLGTIRAAGQLQQRPTPAGGTIFQAVWLRRYTRNGDYCWLLNPQVGGPTRRVSLLTSSLRTFVIIDLAASERTTADNTCISVWGDDRKGNLLLLDVKRERMQFPSVLPEAEAMRVRWNASYVGIESYGFQLAAVQTARVHGMPVRELKHRVVNSDKVAHSVAAQVRMEAGQIYFPEGPNTAWCEPCIDELLHFKGKDEKNDFSDTLFYAAEEMVKLYDRPKTRPPWQLGTMQPVNPHT